jgi:hypothetical protein
MYRADELVKIFGLTLSLTALGPISPISLKFKMLKKSLSEIKAILLLFLY